MLGHQKENIFLLILEVFDSVPKQVYNYPPSSECILLEVLHGGMVQAL